ncbi:MAG TPA: lycopene cyclase domain-containing protein [Bacteroidia bacterium]|jgi:lycopene cyclase domain-containing protein|nr:lycopene cyclase domain-containing protein [Bacteroidia bacterium]
MLNSKYLYLTLDLLSFAFPFLFSFYSKANFSKKWKYVWVAILLPAVLFIAWDEYFTQLGVWGFNEKYLSGIYIGSLPLEEVLFFICIPYACVFTYEALNYLFKKDYLAPYQKIISVILTVSTLLLGFININKWYTCTTFFGLSVYLLILQYILKSTFLSRFYFAYLFILIPFFVVNGILTGTLIDDPVVWYNNTENLAVRIGTIPVEDIFYGMLLILMNVSIFEWHQKGNN